MGKARPGANIIMSGRLFLMPQAEEELTVEIKNADLDWRFSNIYVLPDSEEIDVTGISIRRKGDATDSKLLQGDPINLKQWANDARLANGPSLLEALDRCERDTEVIFGLRNNETVQGVQVTIALIGMFPQAPIKPEERLPMRREDVERPEVEPQEGPVAGIRRR